jgi:hypothetical protein
VGGKDGAAALLGVRRSTLNSMMKRLGILRPKGLTPDQLIEG